MAEFYSKKVTSLYKSNHAKTVPATKLSLLLTNNVVTIYKSTSRNV